MSSNSGRITNLETEIQPVNRGGTNITSYGTGDILFASSSSALSKLVPGTSGYFLRTNGTGSAPTWDEGFNGKIVDYIEHDGDSDTYFGFPGDNQFTIMTGGIDRLNIDSTGNLTIPDYIRHSGGDTDTYFGFPSNDTVSINTNGTERFRITSGGNIGIGTTTPQYPLHVIGAINLTGGLLANGFFGTAGQVLTASGGGGVNTWTTPSSFSGDIAEYITHTGNTSNDLFGFPNNSEFKIRTGGIDRLNIDNTGKIGIGTTTPESPLHIECADTTTQNQNGLLVKQSSSTFPAIIGIRTSSTSQDPFISFMVNSDSTGWSYGVDASDSNKMKWAYNPGSLSSSTIMTLMQDGKLGIGTTDPTQKLEVNDGNILMSGAWSSGVYFSLMGYNNGKQIQFNYDDGTWISDNNSIRFGVGGSQSASGLYSERMRITSAGDVGIGTTSPGYKLDVNGTMNITSGLYANGSTGSSGQVLTSSGGGAMSWTTVSSGGSSPWTTSGSNIYRSSGNVGIGNTNPGAPLHIECADTNIHYENGLLVKQSSTSYPAVIGIRTSNTTQDPFISFMINSDNIGWSYGVDASDSNKMKWGYDTSRWNSTRMTLTQYGELGIGTTSPGYNLDVNGTMHIGSALYVGTPSPSAGTSGQVLTSTGGGAMTWSTVSGGSFSGDIADYITHTGDTDTKFGFSANDTFVINTSGAVRFLVNSTGEGTIGQNTVMGSGHMFTVVDGSTSNDGSYADLVITNMSEHNNARLLLGTSHNTTSSSAFKAAIIADGAGTYSRNDLHFCLEGSTDNTANADLSDSKMCIMYSTGNVGIGTTSPGYKLDVQGTMNVASALYANGSAGTSGQVLTSSGGGTVSWTTVSGGGSFSGDIADYITHTGDTDTYFGFPSNDTFIIRTSNAERFRINSGGEVSIGSNTDIGSGHKMTVMGGSTGNNNGYADLVITNQNENNNARLLLGTPYNTNSSSAFKAAIIAEGAGSSSRCDLHFCLENTSSNTPNAELSDSKMVIKYATGNVGIGITSPAHKFHVVGDIYATGNVTAYSDVRNKKNLKTIEDPVSKIEKINGYTYEKDGIAYTGLVAQELLEVLPEAVCGSEELGYGIAYGNIAGIFVEAIKELNSKIKALENKLSQFV
jgi:hypothetical protein